MTRVGKLLKKFIQNPTSLSYKEIEKILNYVGFIRIEAKGSHVKFKNPEMNKDIVIPIHDNDCKDFYKKLTAKIIKDLINNL